MCCTHVTSVLNPTNNWAMTSATKRVLLYVRTINTHKVVNHVGAGTRFLMTTTSHTQLL